ncbi:MAG TPA: response regulator transcription factor [Vicinamibacterales bacterium]|jgi:DNA-binding NarL/FixJ family response regulator
MRLLLVGTPEERARLRAEIDHTSFTIAGEFTALADARASGLEFDAILLGAGRGFTPRHTRDVNGGDFEEPLTPREVEVLELLAEGLSNKAIAARLGISDQTVKFHVAAICGKLGAANRTDAVRRAIRRGLVSL